LIKFYTANNSTDKLSTVETDLSSCAGSEFSWFQALAAKYFVANPVALKDTPGMMIVATVCRVLFRVREDHAEMYLNDEDAFTMFNFLMSNGTLEYLVANSQPVADSDPMSFTAGRVFDLCEKDGSGSLGAEELEEAMTSVLGKIVTREEIDKVRIHAHTHTHVYTSAPFVLCGLCVTHTFGLAYGHVRCRQEWIAGSRGVREVL